VGTYGCGVQQPIAGWFRRCFNDSFRRPVPFDSFGIEATDLSHPVQYVNEWQIGPIGHPKLDDAAAIDTRPVGPAPILPFATSVPNCQRWSTSGSLPQHTVVHVFPPGSSYRMVV